MERIRNLNIFQKVFLILMISMAVVFAPIYHSTLSRVGFSFQDAIFVPSEENGSTLYSGKLDGKKSVFTVSADKTVTFQHGDKCYGPYTAKEDPTAIPEENGMAPYMTGVELRKGSEILFRGGILVGADSYYMHNEDGSPAEIFVYVVTSDGSRIDADGNIVDPMEPSARNILDLMGGPELTHKGHKLGWFVAVFICVLNSFTILFADELFYWSLAFQIRNADRAEPTEWEIMGRCFGWITLTGAALITFIVGLR